MSGLRALAWSALADAGLLLSVERQERLRHEAMAAGRRLLPRILASVGGVGRWELTTTARSLGLADPALPRILGLGWQQTAGLATIAGTPTGARPEVARLGALLNLGVALFDHVCDEFPERAELLLDRVTPESLDAQLVRRGSAPAPSGDAGVDLLLALIADFFAGARGLGGTASDSQAFAQLVQSMYSSERFTTRARRDGEPPTRHVWDELRRKSALPMETMGLLALLPHPHATATRRDTVRAAAALAGEAIWIVDDLADVREDWDAGCWSRPLWLLARTAGDATTDSEDAIRRLLATGIAASEAHRLATRLHDLRDLPGAPARALLRPLQATVHSWIGLVPD